ncbi:MAG: ribonuclease Y [Lachnospirales bacterium]
MNIILNIIAIAIAIAIPILIGIFIGYFYHKKISEAKIGNANTQAENIIKEAKKNAETIKKEMILEAKEEGIKTKNEVEKETKERRDEVLKLEKRLLQKEETLEKKSDSYDKKEEKLTAKLEKLDLKEKKLEALEDKQTEILEKISGYTAEEARIELIETLKSDIKIESAKIIKDQENEIRQEAKRKSQEILSTAIQRCSVDHVTETTVSVVELPNDEMKGRIIGREGRNIRAIESLTGIDLIIDDTPEAVILSGFDPMRREIARIALEKLIADGRVHPARIEEMVEKAKKEVESQMIQDGESAVLEVGVHGLNNRLIRLLGKMKFRTSYGQNILQHSIEVAYLAGLMAAEIGVDVTLAKRAGLLHDIGKSINHDVEGSHVEVGVNLLKKYKESPTVINACESHHGDAEPTSIISVLVQAADAISAARPGSRRETLEHYIKRLESLERIADNYEGVEKSFAIQAGRELRVLVIPEKIDDAGMTVLSREIAKQIEEELEYPGQIRVNLVRESRVVEYAK